MKNMMMLVCSLSLCGVVFADTAKVTAFVIDEISGEPIEGALVSGVFEMECNPWERVKGCPPSNVDRKRTDAKGQCALTGKTNCGRVTCLLRDGPNSHYWRHRCGGYDFQKKSLFGVWQPDNLVVTIKLQRVEHPIPLSVQRVSGHDKEIFPKGKDVLLLDCFIGDWLPPVGKGKVADIKFTRLPTQSFGLGEIDGIKAESYRDSMKVEFIGADNGLLEMHPKANAALKIRSAPESGYVQEYLCWKGRNLKLKRETNYDEKRCFCFRIRTRRDECGLVKEAYYGKIYGDISFDFSVNPIIPVASVRMRYYLNPTSLDRNLEWDMKTNLCPNPGEVPKEP